MTTKNGGIITIKHWIDPRFKIGDFIKDNRGTAIVTKIFNISNSPKNYIIDIKWINVKNAGIFNFNGFYISRPTSEDNYTTNASYFTLIGRQLKLRFI